MVAVNNGGGIDFAKLRNSGKYESRLLGRLNGLLLAGPRENYNGSEWEKIYLDQKKDGFWLIMKTDIGDDGRASKFSALGIFIGNSSARPIPNNITEIVKVDRTSQKHVTNRTEIVDQLQTFIDALEKTGSLVAVSLEARTALMKLRSLIRSYLNWPMPVGDVTGQELERKTVRLAAQKDAVVAGQPSAFKNLRRSCRARGED
jgi:hypothetical protein